MIIEAHEARYGDRFPNGVPCAGMVISVGALDPGPVEVLGLVDGQVRPMLTRKPRRVEIITTCCAIPYLPDTLIEVAPR